MIDAVAGAPFEATTAGWPTGLAGTIGYRVLDQSGATTIARTVAGVTEMIAGSGLYAASPTLQTPGAYQIVWDDGGGRYGDPEQITVTGSAQPFAASPLLKWDALCDIAAAAAYVGINVPAPGSQDELNLYRLVNSTSRAIRRWCERQFTPERGAGGVYSPAALSTDPLVLGHVRTFDYEGGAMVKLRPYEPRNITAASIVAAGAGGAPPQTLASDLDFVAMPRDKTDDLTWLWLVIRDFGNASLGTLLGGSSGDVPRQGFPRWPGGYALAVTGDWGMQAVPDDVYEAALVTIAEEWANPEGFQSRSSGEISASEIVPPTRAPAVASPFPQRAELLLEPYARGPEL